MRDERCRACGRPTSAGEDFDGPCVYDSDLECAIGERDALRRHVDRGDSGFNVLALLDLYHSRELAALHKLNELRERMIAEADDHERWHNHLVASTLRRLAKGEL